MAGYQHMHAPNAQQEGDTAIYKRKTVKQLISRKNEDLLNLDVANPDLTLEGTVAYSKK